MPSKSIPQSDALAEAEVKSLNELMSRDPEGYSERDFDEMAEIFRAQRERFEKLELEGKKPGKAKKIAPSIDPISEGEL